MFLSLHTLSSEHAWFVKALCNVSVLLLPRGREIEPHQRLLPFLVFTCPLQIDVYLMG